MEKINQFQLEELHIELADMPNFKEELLVSLKISSLADIPEELFSILIRIIRQKKYNDRN